MHVSLSEFLYAPGCIIAYLSQIFIESWLFKPNKIHWLLVKNVFFVKTSLYIYKWKRFDLKTTSNTAENTILRMARKTGVVRAREIRKAGRHPEYLRKLCKSGQLIGTGRGLYVLADVDIAGHHSLVEACKIR